MFFGSHKRRFIGEGRASRTPARLPINSQSKMRTRKILFRYLEIRVEKMRDGSDIFCAEYYDGADLFCNHYGKPGETAEQVEKELDDKLDAEYPYTLYELRSGDRTYRSTDITDITDVAIKLGRVGEVNDLSRISWTVKLNADLH